MEATWISPGILEPRLNADFYRESFIANALRRDRVPCKQLEQLRLPKRPITNGIRGPELIESEYRMLRIQDLEEVFFRSEGAVRVSERQYQENRRAWCQRGDVLVSIGGELRLAGIIVDSFPQVVGRHTGLIPIDRAQVENEFALVYLCTDTGKKDLARYMAGSAQLGIDLDDLREIRVPTPDRSLQIAIGNKVGKAERLLALATNAESKFADWLNKATLSDVASSDVRRLLSHVPANTCSDTTWVIGFDPADRVDPWPHHLAPRTIRMQLRQAKCRTFGDFFDIVSSQRGHSNPPLAPNCYFLSVLDIDTDGHIDWVKAAKTRYESDGTVVLSSDILYSTLNPQEARVGVIGQRPNDTIACSSEFSILRLKPDAPNVPYLLAAVLRSNWIRVQASFLTRSSSLSRRRLDEADLPRLLIPWHTTGIEELDLRLADAVSARHDSVSLVAAAKADVEALIDGTLDEKRLLEEGEEIAAWLAAHPLPTQGKGVGHAS